MRGLSRVAPDWKIRPFLPGDAPAARRLVESVWHEHFDQHPDPFVREFIYTRLSDVDSAQIAYGDRALFLFAVSEGEIVGTRAIKSLDHRGCETARLLDTSPTLNTGSRPRMS